ncbi:hypothetical protein [Pedobacter ureilyticus]|uniref:Uncharacterized protein n=1 Tax=Pedobacter ureilyticus TaxID=1393051 RepID=A0ABW9J896_9SPHI|nr:hypothetical protein [Pedobacter helvus]
MEKQTFDETGLQNLLNELYALPNQELSEQAFALRNQPKLWIYGHFELDSDQTSFLQHMPNSAADFLGQQGGFAIENRLPVTINKIHSPKRSSGEEPKQDKIFKPTSNLSVETDSNGISTAGGTLILEITYHDQP